MVTSAQTAVWEPPPWAEAPPAAAGRHALAERGEGPSWEPPQQLNSSRERPAEQEAGDQVETAKPAKARKAAKAKVSHVMFMFDHSHRSSTSLPVTPVLKTFHCVPALVSGH